MFPRRRKTAERKESPSSSSSKNAKKKQEQADHHDADAHGGTAHHILALQRQLGNAAVQRLLALKREEQIKGQTAEATENVQDNDKLADRERFLEQYPFVRNLVSNINPQSDPKLIVEQLFAAFNIENFEYTDQPNDPTKFLQGEMRGDSSTLVKAFALIMRDYFRITDAVPGEESEPLMVPAARIIGKEDFLGNVDERKGWVFPKFYWIEFAGMKYDLLFHQKEIKEDNWIKLLWVSQANAPQGGYFKGKDYPDVRVYVDEETSVKEHYTLDPRKVSPNWETFMDKAKA